MADVTVVKASVRPVGPGIDFRAIAGEAMTLGQPVYISTAGEPPTVALTDGSDATKSFCMGVVISCANGTDTAATGDTVEVRAYGKVTGYSTNMAVNKAFYVDDDAGVIADAKGTKSTVIGFGFNASTLMVRPVVVDLA